MREKFLSCDWGTSSFRLRLVDSASASVIKEISGSQGIASMNEKFKKENQANRIDFYASFLGTEVSKLETKCGFSISDLKIVISGMASSSIGMLEVPYTPVPFPLSGHGLIVKKISSQKYLPQEIIIISGASTEDDVMRGEETMLAGSGSASEKNESIYIFPGTHSKHVFVRNGMAKDFSTYMTGEFFNLLSSKSILSASVAGPGKNAEHVHWDWFEKGVAHGQTQNILNAAFHIRTNQLFKNILPEQNYQYLSGLLIAAELKDINANAEEVVLVSSGAIKNAYLRALEILGFGEAKHIEAEEALIRGQLNICRQHDS